MRRSIYLGLKAEHRKRPPVEQRAAERPGRAVRAKDGRQFVTINPAEVKR